VKQKDANSSEIVHAPQPSLTAIAPGEVIIGTIVDIDGQGQPVVDYHGNPLKIPLVAVSTLGINKKHIGRQTALLFANGDPQRPVIMGMIHSPLQEMLESYELDVLQNTAEQSDTPEARLVEDVTIDGKRIVLEGQEEIVLKCGEASITLTKAGKILIRGKYLLNRSSGVNRIMGGSVQVN
jgi:hypothetical protein